MKQNEERLAVVGALSFRMRNFLALKKPATQRQYQAILKDFMSYLTARALKEEALTGREALAWATWALNQPGQRARGQAAASRCTEATVLRKAFVLRAYLAGQGFADSAAAERSRSSTFLHKKISFTGIQNYSNDRDHARWTKLISS